MGTNRTKSLEEVTSNELTFLRKDSLKMLLDKFPRNQEIFWIDEKWLEDCWGSFNYGILSLPDINTIIDIVNYCWSTGLNISASYY